MRTVRATALICALLCAAAGQAPPASRPAPPPARITSFTAAPDSIRPGQTATLLWAVENPQATAIDRGVGVVTPRGSRQVSPAATTTYTLSVRGPNGMLTKAVTVTVAGTVPVAANSNVQNETAKKEARLPEGKPDFSGVYGFAGARGVAPPALKPGADKFKIIRGGPNDARGTTTLSTDCMPLGVPQSFSAPYPFQIVQTPNVVVIFYEYPNTFRIIPSDGRPHPADPDPSWMGNSVAHWDGDTLVVDSIGFNDKTEVVGYMHTEALHVVERFHRVGGGSLQYDVTVEDPNVFASPWVMPARTFRLRPELEKIDEFVCENLHDYSPLFKKN